MIHLIALFENSLHSVKRYTNGKSVGKVSRTGRHDPVICHPLDFGTEGAIAVTGALIMSSIFVCAYIAHTHDVLCNQPTPCTCLGALGTRQIASAELNHKELATILARGRCTALACDTACEYPYLKQPQSRGKSKVRGSSNICTSACLAIRIRCNQ